MKTFYLVAVGPVIKSNGGTILQHGRCVCSFDSDLTDTQVNQISEALECANLVLVDQKTYEAEYKNNG